MSISKNSTSLRLATVSLSALAMMAAASPAFAQNNDVDAFGGLILAGCANTNPLTAAPTNGRRGNIVAGNNHCLDDNARDNVVTGGFHTIGERASRNTVRGQQNTIGDFQHG